MAVGVPGLQLVGWVIIAIGSTAIHLLVQPFDHRHMNLLNRMESQGLIIWTTSIMLLSVIIQSEAADYGRVTLLFLAMLLNMYHYLSLLWLICYHGLTQLAERDGRTERLSSPRLTFGLTTLTSLLSLRESSVLSTLPPVTWLSHLLAWHARRDERRRMMFGRVSLDWQSGNLSLMEEDTSDNISHTTLSSAEVARHCGRRRDQFCGIVSFVKALCPSGDSKERRIARKGELVMRMLSAAMQEAVDLLHIKEVPPDFLAFLWSYSFVLHSPSFKKKSQLQKESSIAHDRPCEGDSREFAVVHSQSRLSHQSIWETKESVWLRGFTPSEASFIASERFATDCAKSGMTLHDLQSRLLLVVDKLVAFQHEYEENIRRRARTRQYIRSPSGRNVAGPLHSENTSFVQSIIDKTDTPEALEEAGGWRELYRTFQKAKERMRHPKPHTRRELEDGHSGSGVDVERLVTAFLSGEGEREVDENEQERSRP
mmetsp:Transcript_14371/g.34316  ORF Transcript_14371/g.34316 Transcript_14371/m.34316 type:complete len:484 (+) Transcript_14371:2671-4122(+)